MNYQPLPGFKYQARDDSGHFSELNLDHWLTVKRARGSAQFYEKPPAASHALYAVGMTLAQKHTDKLAVIESIGYEWLGGYYYSAVIRKGENHTELVILENVSSIVESIIQGAAIFSASYEIHS